MSKKQVIFEKDDNAYVFECPHCDILLQVNKEQTNCRIFRHAIYKNNYIQVDPHLPKEMCDNLVKNNLVFGCCKPFQLFLTDNPYADICDYI